MSSEENLDRALRALLRTLFRDREALGAWWDGQGRVAPEAWPKAREPLEQLVALGLEAAREAQPLDLSGPPTQVLVTLLCDLFTADALERWMRFNLGEPRAVHNVRWNLSMQGVAFDVITVVERFGLLNDAFFDLLVEARPMREADIRAVQERWKGVGR